MNHDFGSGKKPIRDVLQQAVAAVAVVLLIVAMMAAVYISVSNSEHDRLQSEETTHTTLAVLIRPALAISDFLEVQRLLGLVTKPDSIFGVLTQEGDLLLSDYEKRELYEDALRTKASIHCNGAHGGQVSINGRAWSFYCTELSNPNPKPHEGSPLSAKLISFRASPRYSLSLLDYAKVVSLLLFTVVLSTFYMRRVVSKKILQPLEELSLSVHNRMEQKDSAATELLLPISESPLEIEKLHESFNKLLRSLAQHYKDRREAEKGLALAQLASQVSHDIRSPLASLQSIIHSTKDLDEDTRIQVRTAVGRIRDIANNLLATNRTMPDSLSGVPENKNSFTDIYHQQTVKQAELPSELLYPVIDSVISHARLQFINLSDIGIHWNPSPETFTLFANLQASELYRLLSNLISNAVEALDNRGEVKVSIISKSRHAYITIQDNGRGIPEEMLKRLGSRGFTFGKKDGNGLGVWHAKSMIESWGGDFDVKSELYRGTTVTICLPLAEKPSWFADKISLSSSNNVVAILDDDPSIHQVWRNRIASSNIPEASAELHHLNTPTELLNWYRKNLPSKALYLCDYEFNGFSDTGLDLIERIGIAKQSVLVTNHWDDTPVRQRCERLGVRILPKSLAGIIPLDREYLTS
jgi:signal transduction histidine kinase